MCGFESQTPWRFIPEASKERGSRPDSSRESPRPGDGGTRPPERTWASGCAPSLAPAPCPGGPEVLQQPCAALWASGIGDAQQRDTLLVHKKKVCWRVLEKE